MSEFNIIERAFQLAPKCQSVVEVRNRLRREGYFHVDAYLDGRQIKSERGSGARQPLLDLD
jgi:hypothetical protein